MSRTALITGASSGIGYELAKIMAKEGFNLVILARSLDKLNQMKVELQDQYQVEVTVLPADLSVVNIAEEVYRELTSRDIHVDILVNNAGFGAYGKFKNTDWERNGSMIQVNVTSLVHLTQLLLPSMLETKSGRIMNVSSTASFQPGPLMAVYFATKSFVTSLSEALANELEGTGVTVTCLCPGPTRSGFQETARIEKTKPVKDRKIPSSAEVAMYGYQAMMAGKVLAIHGFMNKLLVFVVRLLPRKITTKIVRNMQAEK